MPSALEVAAGMALEDPGRAPSPWLGAPGDGKAGHRGPGGHVPEPPLAALERATLPALRRPPCFVTFSGGRDSSLVLAAATRAARRTGLELPVPITFRFEDPRSQESEWQELVIRHLELSEWQRLEPQSLDLIGVAAGEGLRRHGVLYPPNTHFHRPALTVARGATLLTGIGGDQLFDTWRWRRLADAIALRRRVRPFDALRFANFALPASLRLPRERRLARRVVPDWLTQTAGTEVERRYAALVAAEPRRWDDWVDWRADGRELEAIRHGLHVLAEDVGTRVDHPLIDPAFVAALARTGGRWGLGDRTAAMRALSAAALPDRILTRTSKASFDDVFWGPRSRAFIREWSGDGVDRSLVNPLRLRAAWLARVPDFRSAMLLQQAWLRAGSRGGESCLSRSGGGPEKSG